MTHFHTCVRAMPDAPRVWQSHISCCHSAILLHCSVCALLDCRSSSQPSTVCTPARWTGQAWSVVKKAFLETRFTTLVCQIVLHLAVSTTPCCVMTATEASTPKEEPQGSAAASSSAIAGNGTEASAVSGEPGPSEAGTSSSAPSASTPTADDGTLLKVSAFLQ